MATVIQCTCCMDRKAQYDEKTYAWVHLDDSTQASTLHAHLVINSRDCDGPMDRYEVRRPNSWARKPDESDTDFVDNFWPREVRSLVNPHAIRGKLEIEDQDQQSASWWERTDEGFREVTLDHCTDPHCAYDKSSQRDYFAEAMGY